MVVSTSGDTVEAMLDSVVEKGIERVGSTLDYLDWAVPGAGPGKRVTRKLVAATGLYWLGTSVLCVAAQYRTERDWVLLPTTPVIGVIGFLVTLPVLFVSLRVQNAPLRLRLLAVGFVTLLAAVVNAAMDTAVMKFALPLLEPEAKLGPFLAWMRGNMLLYTWVSVTYAAGLGLFIALRQSEARHRQLIQAKAAADRARLDALRLQVNPHFLFNALNAAVSLVSLGRNAAAERVLLRLSDFFRSSLSYAASEMAPLSIEFEDLEAYLDIESIRFGERLNVSLDLPGHLEGYPVPHLILQPLVENAVKHGVSRSSGPATITVKAWSEAGVLKLAVMNSPLAGGAAASGLGIGSRNVQERLHAHYGTEAQLATEVRDDEYRALVTLPVVTAANAELSIQLPPTVRDDHPSAYAKADV
jgi:hypothetical protein